MIVFVDESGLSERPTLVRSWGPKGQTPVIHYSFTWRQLSVIAGVSFWLIYFRLFPGTICTPQCVEFLKALKHQIGKKLLIIWEGLQILKSRLVRQYVEACNSEIQIEFLPAYSPELLYGHLKPHELGNCCPWNISELSDYARRRLRSMKRRPTLVNAFWKQVELAL